jgi:hypothetical protein
MTGNSLLGWKGSISVASLIACCWMAWVWPIRSRLDVRGQLSVGNDSFIDINCVFEGEVNLGTGVTVGVRLCDQGQHDRLRLYD